MSEDTKNRRVGRVICKHRTKDGEKFTMGGIFTPFPGAYSLGLAFRNDDGSYDPITAVKSASGKKADLSDYYVNLYLNETLEPYERD